MSRLTGDTYVDGTLKARAMDIPAGTIIDSDVSASAGISASKLQHQYQPTWSQPNTTATAETRVLHRVFGATGTVSGFKAATIAACIGDSTITVDLKKNGSSILSAPIVLDNANTARVAEAGTISTPSVVAGDELEVVITVSAGTGTLGTGLSVSLKVREDAD